MSNITLQMDLYAGLVMTDIRLWNKKKDAYSKISIAVDTGASVTTISKDILFRAGYNIAERNIRRITTASGVEYVQEIYVDKIMLDNLEINNVMVYAHTFPQESFSSGVLGLNVLSGFDVNLLFSKKLIVMTKIEDYCYTVIPPLGS